MYSKELRTKTGVSRDTLRHYVSIGLLRPTRNAANDYLVYDQKDLETLSFIVRAKNLGFSLEEIKKIEKRISHATCPHRSILPALQKNLVSVAQKIKDLKVIEQHLNSLVQDFERRDCSQSPTHFEI